MARTLPIQNDSAAYRKDWIYEVARRCQVILSELANGADRSDAQIHEMVAALPPPANKLEEVILLGMIVDAVIGSAAPSPGGHLRHRHDAIVKLLLDARADASRRIPPVERAAALIELPRCRFQCRTSQRRSVVTRVFSGAASVKHIR